jgi:hypothetical protein
MAKAAKTRRVPFDNTATEVKPGVFRWTLRDGTVWEWKNGLGLNTSQIINDQPQPVAFLNTLDQAVVYTEAYQKGVQDGWTQHQERVKEEKAGKVTKETKDDTDEHEPKTVEDAARQGAGLPPKPRKPEGKKSG